MAKRNAVVWTTGWVGEVAYRVFVLGETARKYVVTPAVSRFLRPGGGKWLEMGGTMRAPKYAVTFYPRWKGAPRHASGRPRAWRARRWARWAPRGPIRGDVGPGRRTS